MSNGRLARPFFPNPPANYDAAYMAEVVRAFSVFLNQFQNPGELRATTLTLTNLPQNDFGLETGALFQQDGILKVVLENKPHPSGSEATGFTGSVAIVIS